MALIRRMLFVSALAALLLLAWHGLVRGPEEAVRQLLPVTGETALSLESPGEPLQSAEAVQRGPLREAAQLPVYARMQASRPSETDASGYVITGRSWADTVYAACPPEGFFG